MKNKISEEEFKKIVIECLSIADICRSLKIVPIGGNYRTIKSKIKQWNIDTSHFTGCGWNVGNRFKSFNTNTIPLSEILIEDSKYGNSHCLKKRLIKEGIKENECEICHLKMWLDKKIVIELHHINGNNLDNRIENLQMLCPNCHSQTKTFRGCNIKNKTNNTKNKQYSNKHIKKQKTVTSVCLKCGKLNKKNIRKFCSTKCKFEYQYEKANIPSKNDLLLKINELKSFVQIGKFYGKSDKTIKKWCDKYNIIK